MSALVNSDKKSLSDLKAVAAQSGNDNKQYLTFMLGGGDVLPQHLGHQRNHLVRQLD